MMTARFRACSWAGAILLCLALSACGKKPGPAAQPQKVDVGSPANSSERPPEPTEDEMRALAAAEVDEINRQGGMVLVVTATGKKSAPIKVRLDGFTKSSCSPYTKAWRCEGMASYSYPGSDFPAETLSYSRRYQKDAAGQWAPE